MPKKSKQSTDGFNVNQCSLCDEFRLTVGQQRIGGVRYCQDCIRHTLGWIQLGKEGQEKLIATFGVFMARPDIQALLVSAAMITPELRQANAIGESRRRLIESERML